MGLILKASDVAPQLQAQHASGSKVQQQLGTRVRCMLEEAISWRSCTVSLGCTKSIIHMLHRRCKFKRRNGQQTQPQQAAKDTRNIHQNIGQNRREEHPSEHPSAQTAGAARRTDSTHIDKTRGGRRLRRTCVTQTHPKIRHTKPDFCCTIFSRHNCQTQSKQKY